MTDRAPDLPVQTARRGILQRVSVVWLVPLAALVIALGIAWQVYSERGPLIEISFDGASGMHAGETELRYRDVTVGLVEEIAFTEGLDRVAVRVRLDKDIAPYVDSEASFWVVQPQVTTRGVSGLNTVLSGVYIEGVWDNAPGGLSERHAGLPSPPLLAAGESGLRIRLTASAGAGLNNATPIVFKGITVGELGKPELSADGSVAQADAIIFAPYDRLITTATRFWDSSGFTFSIGATGAELDFTSLASLISGGVTFETIVSGGAAVADGADFVLFSDEGEARSSIFATGQDPALNMSVVFRDNVSGLASGAPVELRGVRIGEVANLTGIVDPERFGDERVRLLTTLAIQPGRLGFSGPDAEGQTLDFFAERVGAGLRARLTNASLLTGGLKVEIIEVADAPSAALDRDAQPFPLLPSAPSNVSDVSASAEGVFKRINDLPIEELLASAIGFLDTATALVAGEELNRVPAEINGLVAEMRGIVGSEGVQALPGDVSLLVTDLRAAAGELQTLVDAIEQAGTIERLMAAVDATAEAAATVGASVDGVPDLVAQLTAVAEKAEGLPAEALIAELTETLATVDTFLASDGMTALPAALSEALAEIEATLAELREGGTVATLNQTLGSAGDAAEAVEAATARLPEIAAQIETLVTQANSTLAGYGANSEFSREARAALREIQSAAEAVASLSRALERRPNSIILGR